MTPPAPAGNRHQSFMKYADITIADRNPLKRWLQRRRFADALAVLRNTRRGDRPRVMDFGAGDGELIRQMVGLANVDAWAYEPTPSLMAEAQEKLAGVDSVVLIEGLDAVAPGSFDYVFCLEVFEHLPEKETADAVADIQRLLKDDGLAVIGVPHELFLPALFKGLFRMVRRRGEFDARPGNIWAAVRGRPPRPRPVAEIAPGVAYHFHHLGFDYRDLERLLKQRFRVAKKWFSPLPVLGAGMNSEVYFLLRKLSPADTPDAPVGR